MRISEKRGIGVELVRETQRNLHPGVPSNPSGCSESGKLLPEDRHDSAQLGLGGSRTSIAALNMIHRL